MGRGGKRRRRSKLATAKGPTIPNNRRLKREHPYDDLSERECVVDDCATQIKTRLVILKDVDTCYRHHVAGELVRRREKR